MLNSCDDEMIHLKTDLVPLNVGKIETLVTYARTEDLGCHFFCL